MDRRSFLNFGRSGVLPQTPWEEFCHRVQRTVRGHFQDISISEHTMRAAKIVIERLEDMQHLYALCKYYEVAIALAGFTSPEFVYTRHLLIVHFSPKLNTIEPLSEQACLAQPSVTAGELLALGYQQFARVPAEWTLSQWFASPRYHDIRPFHSFLSGVERISALFADGSQAVLGGFGVNDRSALSVPILNRCIPNLFELLREDEVEKQLAAPSWSYAYRIDSLQKQLVDINIARVFQGHQARLVWVQQFVIRKIPEDVLLLASDVELPDNSDIQSSLEHIQQRVKGLFDIEGVFLYDDEVMEGF
ncbi:MAG: hypothetical protein SOX43_01310 [Pelistega sp.]|nr:hypothetical protein [Pelistega sp.]